MSRFDYVAYDTLSQTTQDVAKHACKQIEAVIDVLPVGRAKALAFTALEECYMWIGKAVRDDQINRNGSAELNESRK